MGSVIYCSDEEIFDNFTIINYFRDRMDDVAESGTNTYIGDDAGV